MQQAELWHRLPVWFDLLKGRREGVEAIRVRKFNGDKHALNSPNFCSSIVLYLCVLNALAMRDIRNRSGGNTNHPGSQCRDPIGGAATVVRELKVNRAKNNCEEQQENNHPLSHQGYGRRALVLPTLPNLFADLLKKLHSRPVVLHVDGGILA
ncbi:hypothetical protein D3C75_933800 [compost metagenome]